MGRLTGRFVEDQNISLDLSRDRGEGGGQGSMSSPGVRPPAMLDCGSVRRSRRRCSWWPSAQTSRRCRSRGAPRCGCHGAWSVEGPPMSVPGWDSPPCHADQNSHRCHRRGGVSSWTAFPGHHCKVNVGKGLWSEQTRGELHLKRILQNKQELGLR